jgi:hypothetical protein
MLISCYTDTMIEGESSRISAGPGTLPLDQVEQTGSGSVLKIEGETEMKIKNPGGREMTSWPDVLALLAVLALLLCVVGWGGV